MKLFQKWFVVIVVAIINAELFNILDWQFHVINILIGFVFGDSLFKKDT